MSWPVDSFRGHTETKKNDLTFALGTDPSIIVC